MDKFEDDAARIRRIRNLNLAETTLKEVALELGVSERDLRDFMKAQGLFENAYLKALEEQAGVSVKDLMSLKIRWLLEQDDGCEGMFGDIIERFFTRPNEHVRDTLFTHMFRQRSYAHLMYLSLHPEDKKVKVEDIEITTIANIFSRGIYNDLSFMVNGKLHILVEAQTTWCGNMALRMLCYYVAILIKMVILGNRPINIREKDTCQCLIFHTQCSKIHILCKSTIRHIG